MKFSSICAFAGLVGISFVAAAPAPMVTAAPAPEKHAAAMLIRDMDPDEVRNMVGNANSGGYNGDDSDYGSGRGSGNADDLRQYLNEQAQQLSQASDEMRQSMHNSMPRPISSYLRDQSLRLDQATRIVNSGPDAITRSAGAIVSLASAYSAAEASFTPQAERIVDQVREGRYNAADGLHAPPTVLAFAGALGAAFVWTAAL